MEKICKKCTKQKSLTPCKRCRNKLKQIEYYLGLSPIKIRSCRTCELDTARTGKLTACKVCLNILNRTNMYMNNESIKWNRFCFLASNWDWFVDSFNMTELEKIVLFGEI